MTFRKSKRSLFLTSKARRRRHKLQRQDRSRRELQLESLEDRRMLAVQLAGILANDGSLLKDNEVRTAAIGEFVFRFNEDAQVDTASLSGIEITRSGGDGLFDSARATTDFNTGGQVVMQFRAAQPGESGNGVSLVFTKSDHGGTDPPTIDVNGNTVTIDLNTNPGNQTTAFDLREAISNDAAARQAITAQIIRGNAFTNIASPAINYSPLTLSGANAAQATTNFNVNNSLQVRFTAQASGAAGNGLEITFSKRDQGSAGAPRVTVNDRTVNIELNINPGNQSTALDVVSAVNNHPVARTLVQAKIDFGSPLTNVASSQTPTPLTLEGANDIPVEAGFLAVGGDGNQVIFRPSERLVDDVYNITILGTGSNALKDQNGEVFLDGDGNFQLAFKLDLGPQVISVVPQPVQRQANGTLEQLRDTVHVYFNDDDLDVASAENPAFYKLIYTNDTVRNTDDVTYLPKSVSYNAEADRAVLEFAAPLDALGSGSGTFRLRIGADEATPLVPATLDATAVDAGDSFETKRDLSPDWDTGPALVVAADGAGFQDGQMLTITDDQGVKRTLEFKDIDEGPVGTGGNPPIRFSRSMTADLIAKEIADAVNDLSGFSVTAVESGNRVFLSGDVNVKIGSGVRVEKAWRGLVVSGTISNEGQEFPLQLAGDNQEPGHRDVPFQNHFRGPEDDTNSGIETFEYNFQDEYGFDPQGNVLNNAITEVQKRRAREIFQLFSEQMGVQFVESQNSGFTIVTGDLRAVDPSIPSAVGGVVSLSDPSTNLVVLDLQDFQDTGDDQYGGPWFLAAMKEVGQLLGIGDAAELPPLNVIGNSLAVSQAALDAGVEPVFPGDHDLIHGRRVHRPESKDLDLYQFEVTEPGQLTAETLAERLDNPSLLDTVLTLYREDATGARELIARNDDYFSEDSFLELEIEPGTYYIGVTASGNTAFDPTIDDTGFGGRSEGDYQLVLNFRGIADNSIVDAEPTNSRFPGAQPTRLDGNGDGLPGGEHNFWFRVTSDLNDAFPDDIDPRVNRVTRTIFVDKIASPSGATGSLANPFNTIPQALNSAQPGDIVRIMGNGGDVLQGGDGDITTLADNRAYEIGVNRFGTTMADGANLQVPKDVTVMIDSGAVFKMRRSRISVGSSTPTIDHSAGALQVLGTPKVVDSSGEIRLDEFGQPIPGKVSFTSLHDDQVGIGVNPDSSAPNARSGDWGGMIFRRDLDKSNQNRFDFEQEGIFLNYVNHADMQFGGGTILVNGVAQVVTPVHMEDSRATISYNTIRNSADAAISATPDTGEETNFTTSSFQLPGAFTPDYKRVGPDIHGNRLVDNSLNGLFIRVRTPSGNSLRPLTVAARWDDTDIVHVLQENLVIQGTPGGPLLETVALPTTLVTVEPDAASGTLTPGTYNYRIVLVDANGNEGPASEPTQSVTIDSSVGTVKLNNLPTLAKFPGFVARRIYRSGPAGVGPYELVAQINANATSFTDTGATVGGELAESTEQQRRARPDARLAIDPGTIVKLERSVIDVQMGAQLIAEGQDGDEVIFTSLRDTRYGAGGTFNTNDQSASVSPSRGDWAGIFANATSSLSLEHVVLAWAGGVTRVNGDFRGFNPVEVHQAEARIAHSVFELNADGIATGADPDSLDNRFGRGFNREGAIFVRGAQPTIVENKFVNNRGPVININVNSLNSDLVVDQGGTTGLAHVTDDAQANRGPLIKGNRIGNNDLNGMLIRGGTLLTQGIWDDTDIVHVLRETVTIPDFHSSGGLRLESRPTESLVVKLEGAEAGFTASGVPLDINDRIGGMLHIVGQPQNPVVLTSLFDDTVGAGFDPSGNPQVDTNNDSVVDSLQLPSPGIPFTVTPSTVGQDLVDAMLLRPLAPGVTISDATLISGNDSAGVYDGGDSVPLQIPLKGAILTTGNAVLPASNTSGGFTGISGTPPDADLDALIAATGNSTTEATSLTLTIDVSPGSGIQSGSFLFQFGSEEFSEFVGSPFNDVLGGFVNGGAATNFLRDSMGNLISVNNAFFDIDNETGSTLNIEYDGMTIGLLANFPLQSGTNTVKIAIGDVSDTILDSGILMSDLRFSTTPVGTGGVVGGTPPSAGDWGSVRLESYSHDRNFEMTTELESPHISAPGTNGTAQQAQPLGQLAPDEKSGDNRLRLGFEVQGQISAPEDVDVYSFEAAAGTEVWLDIDRTTHSLDTVLELIDADGDFLARSNNSFEEAQNPSQLLKRGIPDNHVNILQKSPFLGLDRGSTNPRDAGMRVVLPGAAGTNNTYYVRVRSDGLTKGVYQLQVRLHELDEWAGSSISHADIRYATTGIEVLGQPIHSPLTGEIGEPDEAIRPNDTLGTALNTGSLGQMDRGTIGIAGQLNSGNDVDFFQFDVPGFNTVLDVDYADGLGRPNTRLSVFDANGNFLYTATDSNVGEDRPGPLRGNDLGDLSRGSVGALDPFIGPVPLSGTFHAAVSSRQAPRELQQFTQANPNNPNLRLEPIPTVRRIVDDQITSSGSATADPPLVPSFARDENIVPWHLGDVTLFVSQLAGNGSQSNLRTVNPFTGTSEMLVGQIPHEIGDIDFRNNGDLHAFTKDLLDANASDDDTGNYLRIDEEGSPSSNTIPVTIVGDDGIETYEQDPANPGSSIRSNPVGNNRVGHGIHFEAIVFDEALNRGYAAGSRPPGTSPSVSYTQNILYRFDPNSGVATSVNDDRSGDDRHQGAGTQIVERGLLLTDADPFTDPNSLGSVLVTGEATVVVGQQTQALIEDGEGFSVDDGSQLFNFEFVTGPEINFDLLPGLPQDPLFIRDGDTFFLNDIPFEFDTGEVLVIDAANGNFVDDGDQFTIVDNQSPRVSRTFEFDNGTGPQLGGNVVPISFNQAMSRDVLVDAVVTAINDQQTVNGQLVFDVEAEALPTSDTRFSNRISLQSIVAPTNRVTASVTEVAGGEATLSTDGNTGRSLTRPNPNPPGTVLIPIEEVSSRADLASTLGRTFNPSPGPPSTPGVPGITIGVEGNRANFLGVSTADFSELESRNVFVDLGNDDQPSPGALAVPFLADDSAADIAVRIATELNNRPSLTATVNDSVVTLQGGARFTVADNPLKLAGQAPGGEVTGLAFVGSELFAVSDRGGLYRVVNPGSDVNPQQPDKADYIESSTDLLGIEFQGLTTGPGNVEGGAYSDLLFGIDTSGDLYAFDTTGTLQPIFTDPQSGQVRSSVSTGIAAPNGLAFSTLDTNLWHTTPAGNLRFGWTGGTLPDGTNPSNPRDNTATNNYKFPGGAHGVIESSPFSLEGYSAADQPVMYFEYRLDTENANSSTIPMRDAFRTYVSGDDGVWHLVATNNSTRPGEFRDFTGFSAVQELYDIDDNNAPDSWRQARVPLGFFAGQENLQVRFEFSTAADINLGDPSTTGEELRALAGSELRDGQSFTIDSTEFEFDLGATVVAATGRAIPDGETLTVQGLTFEFDHGDGVASGNIAIPITNAQSAAAVARRIADVIAGQNFSLTADLRTEGNDTLADAVDTGLRGGADRFQANGTIGDNPSQVAQPGKDVDMLRLQLDEDDQLEIDVNPTALGSSLDAVVRVFDGSGNEILVTDTNPGNEASVSLAIDQAGTYHIGISGAPNSQYLPTDEGSGTDGSVGDYEVDIRVNDFQMITPRVVGNRVQLDGAVKVSQVSSTTANQIEQQDAAGIPVRVHAHMSADEVADAIRVVLADTFASGDVQAIKSHHNVIQLIGHTVTDPGPLRFSNSLAGDGFGSYNNKLRGQDNDHEGVFIDNIVIGFAERGELASGAVQDSSFELDPLQPANQIVTGHYDLEIRRASQSINSSFDTNDRFAQQHTLLAPGADEVIDGQTFTISDGVNKVTFEFEDTTIGDGVASGNVSIPFDPLVSRAGGIESERNFELAERIRDAINSPGVQAVLDVTAGFSDGSNDTNRPMLCEPHNAGALNPCTTDHRINLYGNAIIVPLGGPLRIEGDLTAEPNDTAQTASSVNSVPGQSVQFVSNGQIGDNPDLPGFNAPLDVDLVEIDLAAGSRLVVDVDANENGSPLDAVVRVFDESGNQVAFSNDDPAPGETPSFDPYVEFEVTSTGTYFIGISGFENTDYNLGSSASGTAADTTGPYDLEITVTAGGIGFDVHDEYGDKNHHRDQGQLILRNNQISFSSEFGIVADAGQRDGPEGNPHPGPVRNLRELNTRRLVPGVTIENNLITRNEGGAIRLSGDTNAGNEQPAPVSLARIINNTLFGIGSETGLLIEENSSPTVLNNIFANFAQGIDVSTSDPTLPGPIFGGSLFQNNATNSNVALGDSAIVLADNEPLFVDARAGIFYLAEGSRAIDSGTNSMEDRQALITVKNPLGIPPSPILAPERDLLGQLRVDDPNAEPSFGSGENVFVDRGALERADFVGPTAVLLQPQDNDAAGIDQNPMDTIVELTADALFGFSIQLVDGLEPQDPQNGVGVDDRTVSSEQVVLSRDGVVLEEGVDYIFRYDSLNNIIRLTPLAGIWPNNHTYEIRLANQDQFVLTAPDGTSVVDGDTFQITDADGNVAVFEFESGYSLGVAPTLALQIPAAGGGLGGVTDRESIVISDGTQSVTLEFDNNGNVSGGAIPVVFTPADTDDQIAQALVDALITANATLDIDLSPKVLGNGRVHVGTQTGVHTVDLTSARTITSQGSVNGGVSDGETFSVDDGNQLVIFEFDADATLTDMSNVGITLDFSNTHEEIAAQIVAAVEANTTLNLANLGDGRVHVGGNRVTVLDTSNSNLTQTGQPGVLPEFGIQIPTVAGIPQDIEDGDTFQIGDGVNLPVTFEFDDNEIFVPGNTIITFDDDSTVDQIANQIVVAAASVGLGLNPTNTGNGFIELANDTFGHFFDPGDSSLVQIGAPGVPGNVPIDFLPDDSFTAEQMAVAIDAAIDVATSRDLLEGVTSDISGAELILDGVSSVTGIIDVFVEGIRDLAGNILKPNQNDGSTIFTIQLGSGLDFGDAPNQFGNGGYPTLVADDGARHEVDPSFRLGATVTVDVDGQPNATATGDQGDDGVFFQDLLRGHDTRIDVNVQGVTATKPGFLDAWIDFNRDGDWDDPGEQIAASMSVSNGVNPIDLSLPADLPTGTTFARFRLSSTGGLSPRGAAVDGEVEDYAIEIRSSNWQNGAFPEDTTADGVVTPFDALHPIVLLQTEGSFALPKEPQLTLPSGREISAPPFIDVNGDRFLTAQDVVLVVNFLLRQAAGGEGEAAGGADAWSAEGEYDAAWGVADTTTSFALPGVQPSTDSPLKVGGSEQPANEREPRPVREVSFQLPRTDLNGRSIRDWLPALEVEESEEFDDVLAAISQPEADDEGHDAFFADFGK